MNKGISLKELRQFFKYTEQAMKDNKTTVIIDNEMCRFLYKYLKNLDSYFNIQDKEIKRLTNNWNELEEWLAREYIKTGYEEYYRLALKDLYDKMEEIKEKYK